MYRNRGLTLIDLVALVLLAGIVAFFLLPAFMTDTGHTAYRAECMNNVRQIGVSMIQYAGDHDDKFPPLVDGKGNMVPGVDNAGFVSVLPARTAFAVLLKEGYVTTTRVFVCPTCGERAAEGLPDNLTQADIQRLILPDVNCSYGWDPTKKHSANAACAILADKPGKDPTKNSPNHKGEGQNVFYNDGHVKWMNWPKPDSGDDPNIYTGGPGYEKSTTDAKIIR